MLLATCQPEYRVNPAILCFIYRAATAYCRAAKIIFTRAHFLVDATLCRAIEALLELKIRIF
jgi:hypothetical protein